MNIITNHQARDVLYWYDLTEKEREEFDYIEGESQDWARFVRYLGEVYDLGEFMLIPNSFPERDWHGYQSNSYFSGIVIKYPDSYAESIIVGRCLV